jgi:hypothetical protein
LVEALKDKGVKPGDIMSNVRRFERNGFVYVRGYRMHDKQTPFKDGYLLTWIGLGRPREQSIEEAIKKTNAVLDSKASTSPIIERIHLIRDQILEATKLRDLVNFEFIQNKLSCSPYEAEGAIARALQLYPDLKMVKLFNAYNYYYHTSRALKNSCDFALDLNPALCGARCKLDSEQISKVQQELDRLSSSVHAAD